MVFVRSFVRLRGRRSISLKIWYMRLIGTFILFALTS